MKFYSLLLCLPLMVACGSNPSQANDADDQSAEIPGDAKSAIARPNAVSADKVAELPNAFEGTVKTFGLDVVETVFVEGFAEIGAKAPVLVVVQSNTPDTCAHLQNGTYPKQGTFFPIALIQMDGDKVAGQRVYKPSSPDDETTDLYQTYAQLRHFSESCQIQPEAEDGMAILGWAIMDDYSPGKIAKGRYAFEMGQDRAPVSGSFNATYCDAPSLLADAAALMNPIIDSEHCL